METEVRICSIASGSNGNCYWIEYNNQAILIDAGISYKDLYARADKRHLNIKNVIAVFISHEHSDHVCGLANLAKHNNVPVYMTAGTRKKCKPFYLPKNDTIHIINADDITTVGPFAVHSFSKPHDVAEPCSFRVQISDVNIGVFTDIGTNCEGLTTHLNECNAIFMESNYDEEMLQNGPYPDVLKKRIRSNLGHLSNRQSVEIIKQTNPPKLHTIILSHLSGENNSPNVALNTFDDLRNQYTILTASREEPSEIIAVTPLLSVFSLK